MWTAVGVVPITSSVGSTQREEQTKTAQELAEEFSKDAAENIRANVGEFRKWMAEYHPEYPL